MNPDLERLFREDRSEHAAVPPVGTPEYAALRERDRERRRQADELLRSIADSDAFDLYHAAWLLNHGDSPADAQRAFELASRAAELGHYDAIWLSAAAYDRWCMYRGDPQRFGTQIVPDGTGFRVWDTDPATTDAERAKFNVPPLREQELRAARMSDIEAQPDLSLAPQWLLDAIARWRSRPG
jgi:TPR repeat protein